MYDFLIGFLNYTEAHLFQNKGYLFHSLVSNNRTTQTPNWDGNGVRHWSLL